MERRFHCTACGKCCHGVLPLTLEDALEHAGRFPLAMMWMPVPKGKKAFAPAERLGVTLRLRDRRTAAVHIVPAAYLPAGFACPALGPDGLCGIHDTKPLRCRTMPFYPFREEQEQADLLVPRAGWLCDISAAAPVVYRDRAILDRGDFDRERAALERQAPMMRSYAAYVLKYTPWVLDALTTAAAKPAGASVFTSLSSFLTATRRADAAELARRQLPVLTDHAARTAGDPALAEHHRNYAGWAREMEHLASRTAT